MVSLNKWSNLKKYRTNFYQPYIWLVTLFKYLVLRSKTNICSITLTSHLYYICTLFALGDHFMTRQIFLEVFFFLNSFFRPSYPPSWAPWGFWLWGTAFLVEWLSPGHSYQFITVQNSNRIVLKWLNKIYLAVFSQDFKICL